MPTLLARTNAEPIAPALIRPMPSEELREAAHVDHDHRFAPAPELEAWIRAAFLDEDSPLFNAEHKHLRFAHLGILWTNVENSRQMRSIIGQAEMPMARGGKWAKARHDLQLRQWFGSEPDFVITLSAPYAAEADDASFCALVEHELFHCAQARTAYGVPRFSKTTGRPIFAMRGHDSEEFIGVVARYGAIDFGTRALVAAANRGPSIASASLASVCGTVARAAA